MGARTGPDGLAGVGRDGGPARMTVLAYTSLYPAPHNPVHGIFVQELVTALLKSEPGA